MTNKEFQNKVEYWLLDQGCSKIGNWSITEVETDSVRVIIELIISGIRVKAVCDTSNDENAIQNAVLALNEKIVQRLESEANKVAKL